MWGEQKIGDKILRFTEYEHQRGINIDDQFFLLVDKAKGRWGFKLIDSLAHENLTSWVKMKSPMDLRRPKKYQMIRGPIAKYFGKENIDEAIEKILILIDDNLREFEKKASDKEEMEIAFDAETIREARKLLADPAFFYKLGKVFQWGAIVPKIKKPRFVLGEERNKRLIGPLLIGATKLNMTSIVKILGDIGTAKDTELRLWLLLLTPAIKHIERSYITAASLRYSKAVEGTDLLYIPDSPSMKGEKGRQMRFMRADDGGLISEYAMKDPETQEMTTKTVTLPIKGVATTSNYVTGDAALESGMWTLRTNSTEELTGLVKQEKLKLRAGKRGLFPEAEFKIWQAAFYLMFNEDQMAGMPLIPYAETLIKILDSSRSDSRRDPDKLCDLISLIAWMRRFQKPLEHWREADIVDLYIALQIGLDAITQTVSELDKKEFSIFQAVKELGSVTVRQVSDLTYIPYKTCYNYLEYDLIAKGYVTKEKDRGRNVYNVSPRKDPKTFLISEGRSFGDPAQLVKFILGLFEGFSLSRDPRGVCIVDPLTATKIAIKYNDGTPHVTTEESSDEVKYYPYPHEKDTTLLTPCENGRKLESPLKQPPLTEETLKTFLPSENINEKPLETPLIHVFTLREKLLTTLQASEDPIKKIDLLRMMREDGYDEGEVARCLSQVIREGAVFEPIPDHVKTIR